MKIARVYCTWTKWSSDRDSAWCRSNPEFVPGYVVFHLADGSERAERESNVNSLIWKVLEREEEDA